MTALEWRQAEILSPDKATPDPAELLAKRRSRVKLEQAQARLRLAVRAATAPVPCLVPGRGLWLSDRHSERLEAARRCQACPVIAECGGVAVAAGDPWGVWAGHDYSPPPTADDDPDAARLRVLAALDVDPARRAERNRLIVELRNRDPKVWTVARLADLAGMTESPIWRLLATGHTSVRGQSSEQRRARTDASDTRRQERLRAELAASDHPAVVRLREWASQPRSKYRRPSPDVERLVAELALTDPAWTFERIAVAAGMSKTGVRLAVRRVMAGDRALGMVAQGVERRATGRRAK